MNAEDNWAKAIQDGNGNRSTIFQTYDNNRSKVNQQGDDNYANVRQIARPNQSKGNYSDIEQMGNDNHATSRQETSGAYLAPGYSNIEKVKQYDDGNKSILDQLGDFNRSEVTQSGGVGLNTNYANVDQDGEMNKSYITQKEQGAITADNYAKVTQSGMLGNTSHVNQAGANSAWVNQSN